MKKFVIFGCGYLGNIVADAYINGLMPEFELIGLYSRSQDKTLFLANKLANAGFNVKACSSIDELLALKPDFLAEAASPMGMKEIALLALEKGISVACISVGAFADDTFKAEVDKIGSKNNSKVYICSGATGGLDVLRTATLMGNAKAKFFNENGRHAYLRTPENQTAESGKHIIFNGNGREAIDTFPSGLNVAVAASISSVGVNKMQVAMQSTIGFRGDTQRVEIQNDEVHAVVDVYSATASIAGWSIVSTLNNAVATIVF